MAGNEMIAKIIFHPGGRGLRIATARMKKSFSAKSFLLATLLFASISLNAAEDRDARVKRDVQEVQSGGLWIYNDLPKAMEQARLSGKPLLIVLRCIP
jgi:hypothetical protein